jgi:hypothetical protein
MDHLPLAIDTVWATLILSGLVLAAGTALCIVALVNDKEKADVTKQVFPVVGVLFGLLAAGGLGTLFANKSAETAENAAKTAGAAAAGQVSEKVSGQVNKALAAPPNQPKP